MLKSVVVKYYADVFINSAYATSLVTTSSKYTVFKKHKRNVGWTGSRTFDARS